MLHKNTNFKKMQKWASPTSVKVEIILMCCLGCCNSVTIFYSGRLGES